MVPNSARNWLATVVAFLLLPAAVAAAPGAASRTVPNIGPNPSPSASKAAFLLQQIQADAFKVRNEADQLESYNMNEEMDWRTHADRWEMMRDQINHMGQVLQQLEINKADLPPWERKAVDRIRPALLELADNTQSAIEFVNNNHEKLFAPSYSVYAVETRDEAHRIETSVENFEEYAQAKHEVHLLSRRLDLKGNS